MYVCMYVCMYVRAAHYADMRRVAMTKHGSYNVIHYNIQLGARGRCALVNGGTKKYCR
jgi:hypothetical protein